MKARILMYHTVGAHMMGGRFLWIGLHMFPQKMVSEHDARGDDGLPGPKHLKQICLFLVALFCYFS